jgi:hypothetical protein
VWVVFAYSTLDDLLGLHEPLQLRNRSIYSTETHEYKVLIGNPVPERINTSTTPRLLAGGTALQTTRYTDPMHVVSENCKEELSLAEHGSSSHSGPTIQTHLVMNACLCAG